MIFMPGFHLGIVQDQSPGRQKQRTVKFPIIPTSRAELELRRSYEDIEVQPTVADCELPHTYWESAVGNPGSAAFSL